MGITAVHARLLMTAIHVTSAVSARSAGVYSNSASAARASSMLYPDKVAGTLADMLDAVTDTVVVPMLISTALLMCVVWALYVVSGVRLVVRSVL